MNREISYDRNLTGSYMKIFAGPESIEESLEESLDEKILGVCKLPGLLEMRTCILDGHKQLWFHISGRQSLEMYCSLKKVGIDLIRQLVLQTCRQIEVLERYLVDADCLCLNPELIYISNNDQDISFTALWAERRPLAVQFRELLEYLLTKVDHDDRAAVEVAYSLYEKTLEEGYSIGELRDTLLAAGTKESAAVEEEPIIKPMKKQKEEEEHVTDRRAETIGRDRIRSTAKEEKGKEGKKEKKREKWERRGNADDLCMDRSVMQRILDFLDHLIGEGKQDDVVFLPTERVEPAKQLPLHPTVCLTTAASSARGILLYEGEGSYPDIRIRGDEVIIGKAQGCGAYLPQETVSLYHAKVTRSGEEYVLEDLNSTNGTFLNGEALSYRERRNLHVGDMVRIADLRYRFC